MKGDEPTEDKDPDSTHRHHSLNAARSASFQKASSADGESHSQNQAQDSRLLHTSQRRRSTQTRKLRRFFELLPHNHLWRQRP